MDRKRQKGQAAQEPQAAGSPGYTVLARRYRPRDFDGIVGQEAIVKTLRNAVATGRTAHAYLFSGSRGVGKTSMARILARAINATADLEQSEGIAEAILQGQDLDVIEIDGASNRGINEAKDLIAAAGLRPARCAYKVYIIDEVHQITRDAFNALLKTMEEPPKHVKFILCTTEVQKVPATIRSRCQEFDFRLLSTAEIAGELQRILDLEQVSADRDAVLQIARHGRGSMRDALSLLDRLLAADAEQLTVELIEQVLGLPDQALARRLAEAIAEGDPARALEAAAALLDHGATEEQALQMLAEHLRNLLIVVTCGADSELLELSEEGRLAAVDQAARFDAPGLVHMIALADSVAQRTRNSAAARALYDTSVVRMCLSDRLADVAALLQGARPPARPAAGGSKKKEDPAVGDRPPARIVETKTAPAPTGGPGPDLWAKVRALAAHEPADHARLEHLVFRSFDGHTLLLSIDTKDPNLGRWLVTQAEPLARLVRRATSRNVVVEIDADGLDTTAGPQAARSRIEEAERLPVVRRAMEIFDATVVDVRDVPAPGPPPDAEESSDDV